MWIVGILFVMSVMPGDGTKAADQQAIVMSEYTCTADKDCPVCVGGGIEKFNESDQTFLGELSASQCVNNACVLSDACLIWDCGNAADCNSIKKTLLDNTIERANDNPSLLLLGGGIIAAFMLLG